MKITLRFYYVFFVFLCSLPLTAQSENNSDSEDFNEKVKQWSETLSSMKKLKISGYAQFQFQSGEKDASLKVGSANEDFEKSFNRIGIRRGRLKVAYEEGIATGVFQLDVTDNGGVKFKDMYINIKDPWFNSNALRAGVFDRTFGYEISYSSSQRESPERSAVFLSLFPEERDLGAALYLQPEATSPFNFIRLEAGLFAGNGIKMESDSKKDFIGHLIISGEIGKNIQYGLGASYYRGFVYQGTENVFRMENKQFVLDSREQNAGEFAKREYIGFDGRILYNSAIGSTKLHAEYLFGHQPGTAGSSKSPNSGSLPDYDTYLREFRGGYAMLVQDIGKSPFSLVAKYDWYDPNTKVSKAEVGQNGTGMADLAQNAFGLGALWRATKNLRLQAYYEFNQYEETQQVEVRDIPVNDLQWNVFTLRLQYKF